MKNNTKSSCKYKLLKKPKTKTNYKIILMYHEVYSVYGLYLEKYKTGY